VRRVHDHDLRIGAGTARERLAFALSAFTDASFATCAPM